MKKYLPHIVIGVVLLIVVIGVAAFAMSKKNGSGATPTPTPTKKKVTKPVNLIPFEERPYVVMSPTTAREVDVIVKTVPKAADAIDYLAEYQYGTSLGGNEQFIDLKKGLPATKQFALYSRSAGGKTSYEEDVRGGTLTLNFEGQNEYSLKQDWTYFDRTSAKSSTSTAALTSQDGKFEATLDSTSKVSYVIIYNTPGTPAPISGKRFSEIYTFATSTPITKKIDVSIEMTETGAGKLYGWDGKTWKTLQSTVSGNTVKGTQVEVLEAYVVAE